MRSMIRQFVPFLLCVGSVLPAQAVRLPSGSPLFVYQGGDTQNVNEHMTVPSQAYAVDFAVVGGPSGRELARSPASRIEAFYCWNTPVLAPTSGRVVEAVDSFPDNPLGTKDPLHPLGNHVIIGQGERFIYVAHLRVSTVTVRLGDSVSVGQPIGRCGNSGNSDFPHIHVHATRMARFGEGVGLNLIYGPMRVNLAGKEFDNVEWPLLRGLWVRSP